MKLSRVERWMLSNQYRILELLDRKNEGIHRQAQEVLNSGYESAFSELCRHVSDKGLSDDECNHVLSVLEMYTAVQYAYDKLDDKTGIDGESLVFPGFDGNNERSYMGFASFLCDQQGDFRGLRKSYPHFNWHWPTRDLYDRMLIAWKGCKDKLHLTKDDLRRIAQAAATVNPSPDPTGETESYPTIIKFPT